MQNRINHILQWTGAVLIIMGHALNVQNLQGDIVCFLIGTVLFYAWSIRTRNWAQITVNTVAFIILSSALLR